MIRDKREQLAIAGEGVYEMDTLVVVGRLFEQSISFGPENVVAMQSLLRDSADLCRAACRG